MPPRARAATCQGAPAKHSFLHPEDPLVREILMRLPKRPTDNKGAQIVSETTSNALLQRTGTTVARLSRALNDSASSTPEKAFSAGV